MPALRTIRRVAVLLVLLLGADPAAAQPSPSFPNIGFANERPMRLDAGAIELVKDFKPSFAPPEVEHLFPIPPELAIENWVHDRLTAGGGARRVVVHMIDASVREIVLPTTPGIEGLFTKDQAERYDGRVELRIDLVDESGMVLRTVSVTRLRSQSVPDGITVNQRDKVWYDMTRAMMADLDRDLEQRIRQYFPPYVE